MATKSLEEKMQEEPEENIILRRKLITPRKLKLEYPRTEKALQTVNQAREDIKRVLRKEDSRKDRKKIAVVGPCSVSDVDEVYELAEILKPIADEISDEIILLYRTYFQKPRTRGGWRGLVYDPDMDGSNKVNKGYKVARKLILDINELGLPCATEFLDRAVYRRLGDLISWGAIGARSTESQDHRDWVSGYSMPIGFKNSTLGSIPDSINNAIDASVSARGSKTVFDEDENGRASYVLTKGNHFTHVVLRGVKNNGQYETNYDPQSIKNALEKMQEAGLQRNVIVDCSHGNSKKDYRKQIDVVKSVKEQILRGNEDIVGIMMEVNLEEGAYDPKLGGKQRGKSRTDPCLGVNETIEVLRDFYNGLKSRKS
jgi:3-deoxy-7-phosphoheptulonate synthase